jgi:class 3 adenylate cyclase
MEDMGVAVTNSGRRKRRKSRKTSGLMETRAILFAVLCASTLYKLKEGHRKGILRNLLFLFRASAIVKKHEGKIVKELGDGLFAVFRRPEKAIVAACDLVQLKPVVQKGSTVKIDCKVSVTYGEIERITIHGRCDYLGIAIDRCARVNSICRAKQVLVDANFEEIVGTHLLDQQIILSEPETSTCKEFNALSIREAYRIGVDPIGIQILNHPVWASKPLICETCGQVITFDQMKAGLAIFTFDSESQSKVETAKDFHWCHKGKCDKSAGDDGWRDFQELIIPELYLDLLLTIINCINEGTYRFSKKAKDKFFQMVYSIYPYVFRMSSAEESDEFQRTRALLDSGL